MLTLTRNLSLILLLAALLSGCGGTLYATVRSADGDDVMLLGHDPVAYFTMGRPVRGNPQIKASLPHRTYYFVSAEHKRLFEADPAKYEPQHGGFCSNGTPFKIKLGSDPTEWEIRNGRLFIFGDIIGHSFWLLDPEFNVRHADQVWPEIKDMGWRRATLAAWASQVPWYRSHKSLMDEWNAKNPGKPITYDPGGVFSNIVFEYPGWRAREGIGQPALGLVGTDPCPPACVGTTSQGFMPPWPR
ncbi:MAG: YHS domain-containing (seleno)protein [Burkholderiales bacterium]